MLQTIVFTRIIVEIFIYKQHFSVENLLVSLLAIQALNWIYFYQTVTKPWLFHSQRQQRTQLVRQINENIG